MKRFHSMLLAITAVSALIVASLVLAVPDHSGELRTDLEVGDYYILHQSSDYKDVRYTIVGIGDDGILDIEVSSDGSSTQIIKTTPEQYLSEIYLNNDQAVKDGDKRAMIDTAYGERMCSLYRTDLNTYWVDSNNVIYKSFVGGLDIEFVESSLIIQ